MKVDYGVRAILDLAQHYGEGPIQTAEIAARQAVPEPYLDQLLGILRKSGLIHSRRGPHGGHYLAKEPSQISLGAVVDILEGISPPIDCIDGTRECPVASKCTQQDIWRDVDKITHDFLCSTTVGDLAARQAQRKSRVVYYI